MPIFYWAIFMLCCCAVEPAPPVLLGTYKNARMHDPHHQRGTCVALVNVEGAFRKCSLLVSSRGEAAQACDGHLRAPTIIMGDGAKDGIRKYMRFCLSCDALRPLGTFHGFLAHCSHHDQGHSDCGRTPLAPALVTGEDKVVSTRDVCATLVFGKTPRAVRVALTECDVGGCGDGVFGGSGLCEFHFKVWSCSDAVFFACHFVFRSVPRL